MATLNQLKVGKLEAHRDAAGAWRDRIDQRPDDIERRLTNVEKKLGV